jgi:hypothetical protein
MLLHSIGGNHEESPRANDAQAGRPGHTAAACGVTPATDVTARAKAVCEPGNRCRGRGGPPVPGEISRVVQIRQRGSVLQVGAGGSPADVLQGSGTAVCRVRVVPLRTSTKAGTGSVQGCPGAPLLAGVRAGPWREVTAQTQGAWRFFAFGVGTTTYTRGAPLGPRACVEVFGMQPLSKYKWTATTMKECSGRGGRA